MKVAVVQTAPRQARPDENRADLLSWLGKAAGEGARLVVFPECAVSGYAIDSFADASRLAEPVPGPTTAAIAAICAEAGCYVACGLLEKVDGRLYNTALLIGPEGVIGRHRKAHIAPVAADRFVTPGDSIETFEAAGCAVGMSICYEVRFPELYRAQALRGAQLLVVCANWPAGAHVNPDILAPARAAENNLYLLAANRTGPEGALSFLGRSTIIGPDGRRIAQANTEPGMLLASIEPTGGLGTLSVSESGYNVDLRGHRRPDLYHELVERPRPAERHREPDEVS